MGVPSRIRAALPTLFFIPVDVSTHAVGVRVRQRREYMRAASNGQRALAALALVLALPVVARAQATGTISGVVTDPTGAVLPGATVEVWSGATGLHRTGNTRADGFYTIPLLPPGQYKL